VAQQISANLASEKTTASLRIRPSTSFDCTGEGGDIELKRDHTNIQAAEIIGVTIAATALLSPTLRASSMYKLGTQAAITNYGMLALPYHDGNDY